MDLKKYIKTIENFPKEGITFRDVNTVLESSEALKYSVDMISDFVKTTDANMIVGPEARGFLFGVPVAYNTNKGFAAVRKPGKLPRKTIETSYDLEYGSNTLCIHEDAISKGDKVVIIDDLLATGGTILATIKLIEELGGEVVGVAFVIELDDLNGREKLEEYNLFTLVHY